MQVCPFCLITPYMYFRMFSRNNRLDYQLFFSSKGAFRPLDGKGLIVILCFSDVLLILIGRKQIFMGNIVLLSMALALGQFLSPRSLKLLRNPLRRATSIWSPLVAILLLFPSIVESTSMAPCGSAPTNNQQAAVHKNNQTCR